MLPSCLRCWQQGGKGQRLLWLRGLKAAYEERNVEEIGAMVSGRGRQHRQCCCARQRCGRGRQLCGLRQGRKGDDNGRWQQQRMKDRDDDDDDNDRPSRSTILVAWVATLIVATAGRDHVVEENDGSRGKGRRWVGAGHDNGGKRRKRAAMRVRRASWCHQGLWSAAARSRGDRR
ncbi:hypothetical protein BHM03_00054122 [Ensete ventricosum]|nr:hypothetical protein BHM03_00054122 [Ensete ventricosum]